MPKKETVRRARAKKQQGKAPSTQAGEFVREEMEHLKEGLHGVASPRQAIAIGLSKARRAGVDLPPPARGRASEKSRRSAESAWRRGQQTGELAGAGKGRRAAPRPAEVRPSEKRAAAGKSAAGRPARKPAAPKAGSGASAAKKRPARTAKGKRR